MLVIRKVDQAEDSIRAMNQAYTVDIFISCIYSWRTEPWSSPVHEHNASSACRQKQAGVERRFRGPGSSTNFPARDRRFDYCHRLMAEESSRIQGHHPEEMMALTVSEGL
jgi:hypothetical protein